MSRQALQSQRKLKLARDLCETLSIIDVARQGLIRPDERTAGFVESLSGRGMELSDWVPIRGVIGKNEGILTVHKPYEREVRIEGRPVNSPHRLMWYFACPGISPLSCGRLVRLLYRPEQSIDECDSVWWACRQCQNVGYATGRDGHHQRAREQRAELLRLRSEIDRLLSFAPL